MLSIHTSFHARFPSYDFCHLPRSRSNHNAILIDSIRHLLTALRQKDSSWLKLSRGPLGWFAMMTAGVKSAADV